MAWLHLCFVSVSWAAWIGEHKAINTESLQLVQLKQRLATKQSHPQQDDVRHHARKAPSKDPQGITPLDVWAIHDMLLLGYKAPLVQDNTEKLAVQQGADSLSKLLDKIHPVAACRDAIGKADTFEGKAEASWSCLGLTETNFTGPITSANGKYDAANTVPNFDSMLGACAGSKWPRACSYWSAFHTMGVRADAMHKAHEFFDAILRIIAGGALYCFGCTSHWRLLNRFLLPPELQNEANLIAF